MATAPRRPKALLMQNLDPIMPPRVAHQPAAVNPLTHRNPAADAAGLYDSQTPRRTTQDKSQTYERASRGICLLFVPLCLFSSHIGLRARPARRRFRSQDGPQAKPAPIRRYHRQARAIFHREDVFVYNASQVFRRAKGEIMMQMFQWAVFGLCAYLQASTASAPSPAFQQGLRGGGEIRTTPGDCAPAELRRMIDEATQRRRTRDGAPFEPRGSLPLLPFFPMGGNGNLDAFHGGFVDLDPSSPGFHDYNCTPFTYDGHAGSDTEIRSFGEQTIGVPVFAALDGVVSFAQDGWPDMNTNGGVQGNIVAIDHGGGWETSYYHLRNGSVTVSVGQTVRAGEEIGKVASSGNSFGPHLHFEIRENGDVYEPFAGPCRPGPSGWVQQPPMSLDSFLDDFATTYVDLSTVPGLPFEMPRSGQIALDDPCLRFWLRGHNLPVQSAWRVRFYRPDGSEAWDSQWFFFNQELWRNYWFWWEYDIPDMHTITGTWHVRVEFNDDLMVHAPFEVREERTPEFNRPPEPITLAFDPPAPTIDDALFCRVDTSLTLDDLDYDIVRYRYVWTVDGAVIRDIVSAGQADAIPHHSACPGAFVTCTVTPNDGRADGPPASVSITLPGAAEIDLNCDCELTIDDVPWFVEALIDPAGFTGCSINRADANGDSLIDGADIGAFVEALAGN